jgi:hypothetical protein
VRIEIPFWVLLVYFDLKFWFLTVPAAILLVLAGWYGAEWLRAFRWVAFGLAAVLAIPFPVAGALALIGEMRDAAYRAARLRTLDRDETIAGMPLPAGTKILFRDKAHSHIASIELPPAARAGDLSLTGGLRWDDSNGTWSGMLAEDQHLNGWPCRAGLVEFDGNGLVQNCEITTAHTLLGLDWPSGTNVTRGRAGKSWAFRLPPDRELYLAAISAFAPGGVTLWITDEGHLERINSGHGQTIIVRGVPLNSMNFYLRRDRVVAALAQPFTVSGLMLPAETGVQIDLTTGAVSAAAKNWWLSE